jgi:hypothetical protein
VALCRRLAQAGRPSERVISWASHPNACLTCDHFLTTGEFLPIHREQLDRTRELLADARDRGQQRLVDINEPVELNLVRIIDGLQRLADEEAADAA